MATNFTPSSVLATIIQDMEADLRLRNARTLDALSAKGSVLPFEMIEMNWNVIATDSTVAGVPMTTAGTVGSSAGQTAAGTTVKANLQIGSSKIYHQFDIYRTDLKDAARRGSQALRQLFGFHVKAGVLSIRKAVNSAIWTGAGGGTNNNTGVDATGGILGMGVVTDASAAYAGLTVGAVPNWVPITLANGGTARPLTRSLLYSLDTQRDLQESYYDTIVCNPATLQKYTELFDTVTTTSTATVSGSVTTSTGSSLNGVTTMMPQGYARDLAPGSKLYNGVPIISDTNCPAGRMVFFDSSSVKLVSMDLSDADRGVVTGYGQQDNFSTISSADVGGLKLNVALLPQANPGVMSFQIFTVAQLKVENRRQVSAILDLA